MENRKKFSLQITNLAHGVRAALKEVRATLENAGTSTEVAGDVELALAEVLNNIVEHAFDTDQTGWIRVELGLQPEGWDVKIFDNGTAMPGGMLPRGVMPSPERPQKDLPEGGFGWALVRMLARDVTYRRQGGENRVTFMVPVT